VQGSILTCLAFLVAESRSKYSRLGFAKGHETARLVGRENAREQNRTQTLMPAGKSPKGPAVPKVKGRRGKGRERRECQGEFCMPKRCREGVPTRARYFRVPTLLLCGLCEHAYRQVIYIIDIYTGNSVMKTRSRCLTTSHRHCLSRRTHEHQCSVLPTAQSEVSVP